MTRIMILFTRLGTPTLPATYMHNTMMHMTTKRTTPPTEPPTMAPTERVASVVFAGGGSVTCMAPGSFEYMGLC